MDDLYWTLLLKWMMIWGYPLTSETYHFSVCSVSYANVHRVTCDDHIPGKSTYCSRGLITSIPLLY